MGCGAPKGPSHSRGTVPVSPPGLFHFPEKGENMNRRRLIAVAAGLALWAGRPAKAEDAMFRIGAIADAQFADREDAPPRLYRRTPAKLAEAVQTLNHADIDFAVHLGDFIDRDAKSFETVLPLTAKLTCPMHFVLGNHDFAVAEDLKSGIAAKLGMPARYYSFEHKGWVFVVLDGNDLSTYGWPQGSAEDAASRKRKAELYPDAADWDGGIGEAQLSWLDGVLEAAGRAKKNVALFCHFPIFPDNPHNLWNAKELIARIAPHSCVKLWLNGHNHDGNYGVVSGIHCVNLKGMLDTEETAYAVLAFYADRILLKGYGRQPDMALTLR